jgi:hypothetical protein
MILMFNKQYRQEEKLFRELKKKINQSKTMIKDSDAKTGEVYKFDSIDVHFFTGSKSKLKVFDKAGGIIIDMDVPEFKATPYSDADELGNARINMFHHLLMFTRDVYSKRTEKAKKLEQATKTLQDKQAALDKAARDKAAAEAVIANATNRLKSL